MSIVQSWADWLLWYTVECHFKFQCEKRPGIGMMLCHKGWLRLHVVSVIRVCVCFAMTWYSEMSVSYPGTSLAYEMQLYCLMTSDTEINLLCSFSKIPPFPLMLRVISIKVDVINCSHALCVCVTHTHTRTHTHYLYSRFASPVYFITSVLALCEYGL